MKSIDQAFQYYLTHQRELAQQYNGKYLVIKDETVIGVFNSEVEAINR